MPRYKSASLWIDGKKLGKASGGTYRTTSDAQPQITNDGYQNESEAPFTSEITADTIEPVGSTGNDLYAIMLARKAVDIAVAPIEGGIYMIKMRVINAETRWTDSNGTKTGSYTFRGGEPKRV
jgi:hypothetical protein